MLCLRDERILFTNAGRKSGLRTPKQVCSCMILLRKCAVGDAARWHLAPIQFVDTVRPRRASHRAVDAPLVEEETPGLIVRARRRALRRVRDSGDRQRDAKRGDGVRRSNGKTAEGPLFRKLSHTSVFFAISMAMRFAG